MSADDNGIIFGSTDSGFVPRQLADIQRAINQDLAIITDPRTGEKPFQNATDDTILQQVVAIFAEAVAKCENAAAQAFFMRDPLSATKAGLSHLVQLNAITRNPGAPTVVPMQLKGKPSTLIPANSLIGHEGSDAIFALSEDVVLPQSGIASVQAACTKEGPIDPAPNTVVSILTPVSGWDSATNWLTIDEATGEGVGVLSVGMYEENDDDLRPRQQLSTNATSYRQIEAIRAAVADIPGVIFVRAYQNSTLETDVRGIPGKSLACVVSGGDEEKIAKAIQLRVPDGIGYFGNVCQVFYDEMGVGEAVCFCRPVEHEISVRVHLEIVVDEQVQKFPSNGDALVKKAIVEFSRKGHTVCEPLGNDAFYPGQDIIRSYLYTPVNSIGGARVARIELAIDGGEFAERDIILPWNGIGLFAEERIEVILP